MDIEFTVNRKKERLTVQPADTLLHLLREQLLLTGTKEGCGTGQCGACTVLLDGRAVNACLVLAADLEGKEVWTIEGLADGENLHPLQQAFIDHYALQCGFCTPGMIMEALALLRQNPKPTQEEIKESIKGNICRCTGYTRIVEAIQAVAEKGGSL
ncbi:MAG TPA: (2Fe-2S)-binding protein [Syntrophorhabdales bacterium]|nr:(2Fe-2S)-binding protein [Syntrophorhabdales bacterium]